MESDIAIIVNGLNKTFRLPHEKSNSLKSTLINTVRGSRGYEKQKALEDINFDIKKGEFFGIVGRNGSGKSTLLKLISQIYTPDSGEITVNGKLTPFIELGVGFNPELSGRDNVFLNGALLGFNRTEMNEMYDEIVAFAELERFMDQKLKNYSSGMQVRLAFSIAIRANTDILVLDEVLAVGDANFQQKCFDYFEKIKKENKTIVLVTHDMSMVKRYCTRALLIEQGVQKKLGSPNDIARQYEFDNLAKEKTSTRNNNHTLNQDVKSLGIKSRSKLLLSQSDDFIFDIEYELNNKFPVEIGLSLLWQGVAVMEHNTRTINPPTTTGKKHRVTYKLQLKDYTPGKYTISIAIFRKEDLELYGFDASACTFIIDGKPEGGLVTKRGSWVTGLIEE